MTDYASSRPTYGTLPNWVPDSACRYLAHALLGMSIRALARGAECHASTIMRQIRQIEAKRHDPLVDAALRFLGTAHFAKDRDANLLPNRFKENAAMTVSSFSSNSIPDDTAINSAAKRILRRLCETGAVLAVAKDMEKAVVVRDGPDGSNIKMAVVEAPIAQAFALKDWIATKKLGRITRYHITGAGRAALTRLLAEDESRTHAVRNAGFAEAQSSFAAQHRVWDEKVMPEPETGALRRLRLNMAESPLAALSRRKDKWGNPFLDHELVRSGERLREDFELAQMGPQIAQNWERFLTAGVSSGGSGGAAPGGSGPEAARARVHAALEALGPGLSDVALRCCCFLEGLETAEKQLGWSARSGKIVLRIALQRLKWHYDAVAEPGGPMVG